MKSVHKYLLLTLFVVGCALQPAPPTPPSTSVPVIVFPNFVGPIIPTIPGLKPSGNLPVFIATPANSPANLSLYEVEGNNSTEIWISKAPLEMDMTGIELAVNQSTASLFKLIHTNTEGTYFFEYVKL